MIDSVSDWPFVTVITIFKFCFFKQNFGLFITLIIRPRVCGVMVNYEEPFPPGLPLQVKSRVAFTQYANVPMLSLDEIKNGFPWLKMGKEIIANREEKTKPRYVFYYVPMEDAGHSGSGNPDFNGNSELRQGRQNSMRRKNNDHKTIKKIKPTIGKSKKNYESLSKRLEDQKGAASKSKNKTSRDKVSPTFPKNHKLRTQDYPDKSQAIKIEENKQTPSYLYPKVPSAYIELPRLDFEEEVFWLKNKRKAKVPIVVKESQLAVNNEERLKNHRIINKQKKLKKNNFRNEKRLKNHRLNYDREHDPQEYTQSSSSKVERAHKRPKENTNNPLLLSQDGERIEFHIQGHEGPQSYIFGYDTGSGENRHFRLEERLRDGSVKGHYGYYDSNGKLKMVEYKSRPMEGYEEKHHKSPSSLSDEKPS